MDFKKITTSRGEVIGIGELKIFSSKAIPYEFPMLSSVVINDADNSYVSTCIDLHIDGDGFKPEIAIDNMINNVMEFLRVNFAEIRNKERAWDYLKELSIIDDNSVELWNAFSVLQLTLFQEGLKTEIIPKLLEYFFRQEEEIKKLSIKKEKIKQEITHLLDWISDQQKEIDLLKEQIIVEKTKQFMMTRMVKPEFKITRIET